MITISAGPDGVNPNHKGPIIEVPKEHARALVRDKRAEYATIQPEQKAVVSSPENEKIDAPEAATKKAGRTKK
jgi:hypothetical protein